MISDFGVGLRSVEQNATARTINHLSVSLSSHDRITFVENRSDKKSWLWSLNLTFCCGTSIIHRQNNEIDSWSNSMKLTHIARWKCRWEYGYYVTLMFIASVAGFRLVHKNKNDATTQQLQIHGPPTKPVGLFLSQQQQPQPNESERLLTTDDRNRRRVLTTATTAWTTVHFCCPNIAVAVTTAASESNIDATALNGLQDLPTYNPMTTVRLYLCRHGETDYNRNNMIQGARIDPPINDLGREQAKRLGQVLSRTIMPHSTSNTKSPVLILHSPLLRAKQTAELVAEQIRHSSILPLVTTTTTTTLLRPLVSLAEVDFGGVAEGAPVSQYRSELLALYTSWAVGNYQARMSEGGESGIEVRDT